MVSVRMRLPDDARSRASFYVVRYDEFYNGRLKVVLDTSEIVKVDNFFCPITSHSIDASIDLREGEYVVIPFPETVGTAGEFTLSASTEHMADIDFYKIPKTEKHVWKQFNIDGEWTEANSGGGDILGLEWRRNPQYLVTLTRTADLCVALKQDETTLSIGFYIVRQVDAGKKVVSYEHEVAKTDSFKNLCSTGVNLAKVPAGNYVIITSAFEASQIGKYHLIVYTDDQDADVEPVTKMWDHSHVLKGEWKDETAGGSPNNPESFTHNPQYRLQLPAVDHPVSVLVQLIQESSHFDETGIGFFMLKRHDDGHTRLRPGQVQSEDVRAKPEGWIAKVDVMCRTTIQPDESRVYTIIPSTFKPGVNRSFHINVFSEDNIFLELLPQ